MGDDVEVVIEPPELIAAPPVVEAGGMPVVEAFALWHEEHARVLQANAELVNQRIEEACARIGTLEMRMSELDAAILEAGSGTTMAEALDTVEQVGEVIADVTEAVNAPNVEEIAPPSPPSGINDSAESGELEPDTGTAETMAPPANANGGRRRSRIW